MELEYDKLVQLKTKGELQGFIGNLVLSGFARNQWVNVSNDMKSLMHRCFYSCFKIFELRLKDQIEKQISDSTYVCLNCP